MASLGVLLHTLEVAERAMLNRGYPEDMVRARSAVYAAWNEYLDAWRVAQKLPAHLPNTPFVMDTWDDYREALEAYGRGELVYAAIPLKRQIHLNAIALSVKPPKLLKVRPLPAPQIPAPQIPAPQIPAPQIPAPQMPAPQIPAPQIPAPQMPPSTVPQKTTSSWSSLFLLTAPFWGTLLLRRFKVL